MYKIYVAGAITDSDPLVFLNNIRKGIRMAALLIQKGYAVFCPHLDHQIFMHLYAVGEHISHEKIKAHSMEWLRQCDAVLVLPGFARSVGTHEEMVEAMELNIPTFFHPSAMETYFDTLDREKNEQEGTKYGSP